MEGGAVVRYVIRLSRDPAIRTTYAIDEGGGYATSFEWHAKHYDSREDAERINAEMWNPGTIERCRCDD